VKLEFDDDSVDGAFVVGAVMGYGYAARFAQAAGAQAVGLALFGGACAIVLWWVACFLLSR